MLDLLFSDSLPSTLHKTYFAARKGGGVLAIFLVFTLQGVETLKEYGREFSEWEQCRKKIELIGGILTKRKAEAHAWTPTLLFASSPSREAGTES